ncbi:hypothetical protein [Streptosporangium sp. NPDC000396]|uniref:hypothetical protein n=1 Tax=Streptosporangium sp. NPDC000396 TaxID=3366185 RepID=UPI0036A52B67
MNGRRRLMLLGSALLATLTLGPAATSPSSAASAPAPAAGANTPQSAAASRATRAEPTPNKPQEYWAAYEKGYDDAGKMCDKQAGFSYKESDDWDRKGWVDGYNAGHQELC